MSKGLLIFFACLYGSLLQAQTVINALAIEPSVVFDGDEFHLLDVSDSFVLMGGTAQIESIGPFEISTSDSTSQMALYMPQSLESIVQIELINGNVLAGLVLSNGDFILRGGRHGEISPAGILLPSGSLVEFEIGFFARFNSQGDLIWIRDHFGFPAAAYHELILTEEEDFYFAGMLSSSLDFPLLFGNDTLISTSASPDFPMNLVALKFGGDGEELWGRVVQSNGYSRLMDTALLPDGSLTVASRHFPGPFDTLSFGGESFTGTNSFVASYGANGSENWFINIPWNFTPFGFFLIDFMEYVDQENELWTFFRATSSDSVLIDGEWLNTFCSGSMQHARVKLTIATDGGYIDADNLGCVSFTPTHNHCLSVTDQFVWHLAQLRDNTTYAGVPLEIENDKALGLMQFNPDGGLLNAELLETENYSPAQSSFGIRSSPSTTWLYLTFDNELSLGDFSLTDQGLQQTVLLQVDGPLSTSELSDEVNISLVPNPASSAVVVSWSNQVPVQGYTLYNLNGQIVASENGNWQGKLDLDTQVLDAGVYQLVLYGADDFLASERLLIAR